MSESCNGSEDFRDPREEKGMKWARCLPFMFLSRHGSTKPFRTTVGCTGEIKSGIQF